MKHLLDYLPKLKDWVVKKEQPEFRARQIRKWICENRVCDFAQMTDLPQAFRTQLTKHFNVVSTQIVKHQMSADGTEKLLLQLSDGGVIECVLLRDGIRRTICVSSQVGCAMGCVFCASGLDGLMRNLTAGEIIEQMLLLQQLLPHDERLSHIVMMGMGEPLANLDNVIRALDFASSPDGLGLSARRITISTVGLPAAIVRLARQDCRYNLAISLHAPNDKLRTQIVPVNEKIGIDQIMSAADLFFDMTGRRLTFEYVLLAGINDELQHAKELGKLLSKRNALLNVIPYNPVEGLSFQTPSAKSVRLFRESLERNHITVKFRQRKGNQINAACGQLRRDQPQLVQLPETETSETISK